MEDFLYTIIFFGGFILIGWVFPAISTAIEKHREKIRDQVADEVLSGLNINGVIENYKIKLAHIKNSKFNPILRQIEGSEEQLWGRNAFLTNECSKCKEGHLIVRKGKYGKFIGCTEYPKCDYTNKIAVVRAEYKKSINDEFADDIRKAYSQI